MSLIVNGVSPSQITLVDKTGQPRTPNVYVYSTTGNDLKEAKRTGVSSYTSTQLNGWVGKQNDTWSGITNASELEANKYYYLRVYVTDTQKYGRFCVMFKSASGTTITVDNKGWGYDGEVIYSTPVWGKPFSFVGYGSSCTVLGNRNSSPNEHANTGSLGSGGTVYYGDEVDISVAPTSLQYEIKSVKINGVEQLAQPTPLYSKTMTVSGGIVVNAEGGRKSSKTKFQDPEINGFTELVKVEAYYDRWQYTINIYNVNNVTCTARVLGYKNGNQNDNNEEVSVNPGQSKQIKLQYSYHNGGSMGSTAGGYKVEVYFEEDSTHYASNTVTMTTNGYTDDVETTTTTTT